MCLDACIYNAEVLSMCNKHLMLGQTAVIRISTYTQHFHSSTALSKHRRETRTLTEAMKVRQKCRVAGSTTGCSAKKAACIEEKQRVMHTAVRYIQESKQTIHTHTHTHTHTHSLYVCIHDCLRSESESASHSSPQQLPRVCE